MSVCVNIKSKEFKDLAKRLDISEASLENILHEYMNTEGNTEVFPSDSYIMSKVEGEPFEKLTEKEQKLIDLKYKNPITVDSFNDAQALINDMAQYFDPKHIGLKETYSGKFIVSLAGLKQKKPSLQVRTTPIKEQYKGKLIFAQSGTGKTTIADNVNVFDSDFILGEVLHVPTSLAGTAFNLLGYSEKIEKGKEYRNAIREKLSEGKTVVTANLNMMDEADVVVYNESVELSNERTNAKDRGNRWENTEYQRESLERINEHIAANPSKEVYRLGKEQHLSDVILSDTNYNIFSERVQSNPLNILLNDFISKFGINIEEYQGEMPLFDALNRVLLAKSAEDVPDLVGEAVAFMMQYSPDMKQIIASRIVADGKVKKSELFSPKGNVLNKYNTSKFAPVKAPYFKEVGKEIANQIRALYNESNNIYTTQIEDSFIRKLWNVISEFFNNLFKNRDVVELLNYSQNRLREFSQTAARNILAGNEGLVLASLSKPKTNTLASRVNVKEAFDNNPYEREIIKNMSNEGIGLAGSTSIAAYAQVLRPNENPLHDLDFSAGERSAEELEGILSKYFNSYQPLGTILDEETGKPATLRYVVLDRPFHFEKSPLGESFETLVDNNTGEILGNIKGKSELTLNSGVRGKALDFFVTPREYELSPYNYEGETYLLANPKEALEAKIAWMRLKDIFDYNRAIFDNFIPSELSNTLIGNNSTYFNIEGKSLREYLRDRGLIHAYNPTLGVTDTKAYYVTKGDGTYSLSSQINQIQVTLRRANIPTDVISFEKTKAGNALKVSFHEQADIIEKSRNKDIKQIRKVVEFLQSRIPAINGKVSYISLNEASKVLGRKLRNNENSFVKGNKVYLVGRRFTEDIAIEECLHPFTTTLSYENPFLYERLSEEARKTFPKLWEDIVSNYSAADGFTHEDRVNELVTQSLSRAFREEFNQTKEAERKTFSQYVKQFINWFKGLFYRVNPVTGNQIIDLDSLSPKMSINDLASLINTSDTEFATGYDEKVKFNKERLTISPEDSKFITETIYVKGLSEEKIREVENLWNRLSESIIDASAYETVSIPYSEWKKYDVSYNDFTAAIPSTKSSISEINNAFYEELDIPFPKYNSNDKTIEVSRGAVEFAKIVNNLAPIMDTIISSGEGWNFFDTLYNYVWNDEFSFEDFLSKIGGEFYYRDSRQLNLFDDFGNVTKEALQEDGLSKPTEQTVRPELGGFQSYTSKIINQLNNLLDSDLMSNTEVRDIAEQTVYFISDSITELLENPERVFNTFPELAVKGDRPMTEEERRAESEKISQMSRVDFARYITPERLIEFTKARLFSPVGNNNISNLQIRKKAKLIRDNFDAIIRLASDAFSIIEDFSIVSLGDKINIIDNLTPVEEGFNDNNDADFILENEGSLQEHWQIESRTQDVISSMSTLVKNAINRCFQIKVNDNGEEEYVTSEFGIAKRVNAKEAVSSILRWTKEAESLSHMRELIAAKAKENPWVKQLLTRLEDTTGAESDFQSQFYGVFAKDFQSYSVVTKDGEYKSISVNERPASREVRQSIEVAFKTDTHPLFNHMQIRRDVLETLTSISEDLLKRAEKSLEENDRGELINLFSKASSILGYNVDLTDVNLTLDNTNTFHSLANILSSITINLNRALSTENYDPFKFGGENSISGYLKNFLDPFTERLEDTAISSFYDSGKMYQSYVTPSYLTTLMKHFTSTNERFQEFLQNEYGNYEWFKTSDGQWRNKWLETLDGMSQEERKNLFKHKVQLNFNKHNYMRNMSDTEYALSIMSEFFSEYGNVKGFTIPVWYRVPMMSNKPSSEFIRFYAYTGTSMRARLTREFSKIFNQELSRIQTVEIRDYNKSNPNFIKSFDKNGKKFVMVDFFNKYLKGGKEANSELGKLIDKKIQGRTALTADENSRMLVLVNQEIMSSMEAKADAIISEWKANGIFEGAKQIANVGKDDAVVESKLKEFIWNDTFASMNILELTITDPAFYKDAEDLQKRLAQIHAPGIRANVEATDYNGKKVTDGKFRTILLKDFDDFVSNIKDNLRIVFDKKLNELERSGVSKENSRYKAAAATYENIIDQFNYINVADAQGYSSPTSYRKKAFIFGKWSKKSEDIYQKLKAGNYNYNDLQAAFQPLKPFVYGQISKPSINIERSDIARPLNTLKVPVQFKNSEYLLIMADAILQGEDTGKPNLLRAIYEVMEESANKDNTRGIDTIQFESTCKSGLMAPIDIKQYYNTVGGETAAKMALEQAIYNEDGSYNTDTYVYEVPFENYAIQQEVPEHFKDHYQAHGSQIRYIIPSDLETVDSEGNQVTYNYFDRGVEKHLTADEFKREYERNISLNIEESLNNLSEQLGIGDEFTNKKDRNIALSKILLEEIWSSPRYGVELAVACSVNDETGEFNIPLGDPIQSKRVEQLINSVVKNRVNKQEIAGGPVVQVTNFGTSKELNIRFNNKAGGLLMTRAEFEKTVPEGKSYDIDAAYKKYVEENQAGIAYYEVFAPIFANELFEKFADRNGNIDIETIEMINPDLLKMIGYRIPTEDKYSMAPLKIVGFLPREAGDGIMLPNDITLLTGSDFDVDKFYLMRKEIDIASRMPSTMSTEGNETLIEAAKEYNKENKDRIKRYLKNHIPNPVLLTEEEENSIVSRIDENSQRRIEGENERHEYVLNTINERAEIARSTKNLSEKEISRIDRSTERTIERENRKHERNLERISNEYERQQRIEAATTKAQERKLNNIVENFLQSDIFLQGNDPLFNTLKKAYIEYMFDYIEPTQGTTYRNNKIVDMSWAVLTNETTASKMLTPGGFEPQKRMGYLISAYQNPSNTLSWEQLNSITDIEELKSLCYTDKNLSFIDTHLQFYKQNSAASTALGMAAVQKVAHAVLESNGFQIDVAGALNLEDGETFSIAGKEFGGMMQIDNKYNDEGALIGRTLGEFVAMFADAVKDPVANLMNINSTTMPLVTALIRFGMPFEKAALFISQPVIKEALNLFNSENVTNFVRLSDIIQRKIDDISNTYSLDKDSRINELNTLSEEELIDNLNPAIRDESVDDTAVADYKVLRMFQNIDVLAQNLKSPTYATRFNSISNAVGPLVIDNLIKEYKALEGNFDNFYDRNGNPASFYTILNEHPILDSFYKTLNLSREILDDMPINSSNFRTMLSVADSDLKRTLYGDRKLLSELSDFYQSYLLIASGAIPTEATVNNRYQGLKYYTEEFANDFIKGKAKEIFKGNSLIDAIKIDVQNNKPVLRVDITGLTTQDKEKLSGGWTDLYNSGERGKKLAEHLFYYNFFRTGIGFSPKSFMNLFPSRLKSKISRYNETFIVHSNNYATNVAGGIVLDQFVGNNSSNNKLAPLIKIGDKGTHPQIEGNRYTFSGKDYASIANKFYIKIKTGDSITLLKRVQNSTLGRVATYEKINILGNNGEYFEASIRGDYTPLNVTKVTTEQRKESQINEVSPSETQSNDIPAPTQETPEAVSKRTTKIRDMLLKMFMMTGRTQEQAQNKLKEFKEKPESEKRALRTQMKKFMDNKFKQLGIEADDKLLEEMYKELC